jgi:hypothetical protein
VSEESEEAMPAENPSGPEQPAKFRSPKRTLARAFRLSRDRWKAKAGERREQLRALKVRLRDVAASRALWKQKALHLQEQLDALTALPSPSLPEASSASLPQPSLEPSGWAPPDQAVDPPAFSAAAPSSAAPASSAEPVKKKRRR